MKVSFEFTTENENRSTMLLVAEFCNALARNVAQPVLSSTVEPGTEKQPIKTIAEIIAEERAKTASMKKKAPAVEEPEQISKEPEQISKEPEQISEETAAEAEKQKQKSRKKAEAVAKRTEEKEAAEKLEAERQAETDRLTAEAAKLEAKRVAEAAAKEAAAKEAAAKEAAKEAAAKEAAAPEQTPLTIKDCRDLAMRALNKQRKDLIQEAFAKVGCPNFPALEKKPEMFATFMEHIKTGLNE